MGMNGSVNGVRGRLARIAGGVAVVALLAGAWGCSSTQGPENQVELSFDFAKCQPLEANLYKCPAVDKPVCSPDYNGSANAQCVRVGPKGSVFVMRPGVGE